MSDNSQRSVRFMDDFGMDFAVRCVLTGVRYGMSEAGEILRTVESVTDGDADSWRSEWLDLAQRLQSVADEAAAAGHRYSAWGAYLRASNYAFAGNWYAPATADPSLGAEGWRLHRQLWDRAVEHWPTPAEAVEIPFAEGSLPAFWFAGEAPTSEPRPVAVIVNGIETPMSDTTMTGLADGIARGYRVLCFDGPGQGAALYERNLAMSSRWGEVLTAVIEWAAAHDGADPGAVCLQGINHGGLFALRGALESPTLAALVLDPGVTDLVDDVIAGIPNDLRHLWEADGRAFDQAVEGSEDPEVRFWSAKTLDPFPRQRPSEALAILGQLGILLEGLDAVSCPVYVAAAENAESFAGQGEALAEALQDAGTAVTVDRFTKAEGAALDCEILAPQVRNQRVYDWLDRTLR